MYLSKSFNKYLLYPDNKLLQKSQINLQNKKKKSPHKKITGFQVNHCVLVLWFSRCTFACSHSYPLFIFTNLQFAPGSTSEVLITSADSRVRVVDGIDLVHKFKGM